MTAAPFHLGWFLGGFTWRGPTGAPRTGRRRPTEDFIEFARALEGAGFDYVLIEDSSFVCDAYGGSTEAYLKHGLMVPKYDPASLATVLTQFTTHLGVVPTLSTSEWQPYMLARYTATLDHISEGRGGWNIVTGSSDRAAQNYGRDALPDHAERYLIADEFADLVTRLWASWEPDAIVDDATTGVFADHTKVHRVDFEGHWFRSRGPLVTARPPQGRPVIVQAGGSPSGRDFAAKWADTVIGYVSTPALMRDYREGIRRRATAHGRRADDCKVLFLVTATVADTDAEAREAAAHKRQRAMDDPERGLAYMGFTTNIDFSAFDVDTPLDELASSLSTNGHQSVLDSVIRRGGQRTLREVLAEPESMQFVGAIESVAAQMDDVMQEVGGDGFLLMADDAERRTYLEITDGLVPALQARGLVRRHYDHAQFRDNLSAF